MARVRDFMKSLGYEITTPYCGIETAFRCEYGSDDGPVFAFASEYDALPEIGHGCGHNLICMAGIAAFLAAAELLKTKKIPGKSWPQFSCLSVPMSLLPGTPPLLHPRQRSRDLCRLGAQRTQEKRPQLV